MSSQKRIVITGASGMLAQDLIPLLEREIGAEIFLSDIQNKGGQTSSIATLDITNKQDVECYIAVIQPDWIINCAAFTAVDLAETSQNVAFEVNSIGPANLSSALRNQRGRLLHLSTDYVFGGNADDANKKPLETPHKMIAERTPYSEDDKVNPCGIYGQSKRLGDDFVKFLLPENHLIVRTSWLHGIYGPNFIATILKLAKEREEIRVVNDQVGSPTWSFWLGEVLTKLIKKDAHGIFHASSRGNITWFEFAKEIVLQAGMKTKILPQTTAELGRPAPRPRYSTLDVSKLENFLREPCISWKESVHGHLKAMGM